MSELSWRHAIGATAGFGVSLAAFAWLATLQPPPGELAHLGFICAMLSVATALAACWAVPCAFVVRERGWSARMCKFAGVPFVFFAVFFLFLGRLSHSPIGELAICVGAAASYITRKLAYPELTAEQVYAPEPPPSLFSR